MAEVTYDEQAFIVGGRRVFLVSGAIHYLRIPRELWRARIRAAKQAGLNCIETYAFWNAHEPASGTFDFDGDKDLRRFIEIVGEEGMWCWLRPGPYACAEWDGGGLPAWLETVPTTRKSGPMKIREASEPFLAACSRYLSAVMEQVRGLQVVGDATWKPGSPKDAPAGGYQGEGGGPILLMQVENEWFSHSNQQHDEYHRQLARYLLEGGCRVPMNACNQLWQPVDGTIHTWNGSADLPASLRQLALVQPDAPRVVSEYWTGWFDHWGGKHADTVDAQKHLYRLAGILGAGAMPNLFMFHGGTNFGFWGGRTVNGTACYMTTSYDYDAPLHEAGGRGEKYAVTKRICTFASQFGQMLANLDPTDRTVTIQPGEDDHPPAVVHRRGSLGDAVFVTRGAADKTKVVNLQLPQGFTLPVHLGSDRAAWLLVNAKLNGELTLDFTNLRPFAWLGGKLLVLFGPAGTEGIIGVNGALHRVEVPKGKLPLVVDAGPVKAVVLNESQADVAYTDGDTLAIGVDGFDDDGNPRPTKGRTTATRIDPAAKTVSSKAEPTRTPTAPKLAGWEAAGVEAYLDGNHDDFKPIKGPASLGALGVDLGYGWYRVTGVKGTATKATSTLVPNGGDRLHVFRDGKPAAVLGFGPGAKDTPVSLSLAGDVVVLADNLGRFNYGQATATPVGLRDHFAAVKPLKPGKPKADTKPSPDPFELFGMVYHRRQGETPLGSRLTWTVKAAGKKNVLLRCRELGINQGFDATVVVNGQPVARVGHHTAGLLDLRLDPADTESPFKTGNNEVALHCDRVVDEPSKLAGCASWFSIESDRTTKAEWAFAPWSPPDADAFADYAKTPAGPPTWYRVTFTVKSAEVPLFFDASTLSKGQLYLNGRNVGRYFCRTADRKAVPPQSLYYLPEPWLNLDEPNELLLFDENGFDPTRTKLAYRPNGPFH